MQPSLIPMHGPRGPAGAGLRGQVGVGDDRARHRDQVDAAGHAASAIAGSTLRPATTTGMPSASRKRRARSLKTPSGSWSPGHEVGRRQARRARAAAQAEQVDRPCRREAARDLDQLVRAQPAGQALVDRHAEPDDEVVRHRGAHGFEHLAAEARAVLQAAAVLVRARVDARVEELLDQVPAERRHLAAVPAAALRARRRVGEPLHDLRELRTRPAARAPRGARPPEGRTARAAGCPSSSTSRAAPCGSSATCTARRGRGHRRPARAARPRCARPRARSSRTTPRSSGRPTPSRTS